MRGVALTISKSSAGFSFYPALAVTVLWVLDVFPGMEQGISVESVVNVPCVRYIASGNNPHKPIVLPHFHFSSISHTSLSGKGL